MIINRFSAKAACLIPLLSLLGCTSLNSTIEERFDPLTGATVTAAGGTMILYSNDSGKAAFSRSLLNVGPLQIIRNGTYHYYLWLGIWGTVQDPEEAEQRDGFETLVLYLDGEPLALKLTAMNEESIGASERMFDRPVASSLDAYYEVTRDQLRVLANATVIHLRTSGSRPRTYEPWRDQQQARESFNAFLGAIVM